MAERRMFAKTIIDSDAFLDMPLSAQALYFHLSMRADDDGFVNNPKRIQRTIGGSDDDYRILLAKNFIISFDSGVIVIKHWKIHNYIRGDRKKDTAYPEEMSMLSTKENGAYTLLFDNMGSEGIETVFDSKDMRKKAYDESELPYSFDYKIRNAFYGKKCPVCGTEMRGFVDECGIATDAHRPTIQHNKPLSKGGKHELGNISVICHQCNVSIQDNETGELNSAEVIKVWDCLSGDSQMSGKCQANVSIGKDSIGKNSIDKISKEESNKLSGKPDAGQKEEYGEDIKTIIAYLNEKAKKNYRSSSEANKKLIRARLKEGYTVSDFRKVIDIKTIEWLGTSQEQYLRPETLFCSKHFESYLNQNNASQVKQNTNQQNNISAMAEIIKELEAKGE